MSSASSLFVYKKGIVNQDVWNHIVFIVDKSNSQIKIFQNGELIDTKSDVHIDIPTHFDKMQIGYDEKSDTHIQGKLDDLYIFNRTLTEYDVKRLYQEKFENQLLLRYDFENIDSIKQIVYDSSGYLNDATVVTDRGIKSILHSNSWDTTLASNTYGVIQDNNTTLLGTMLEKCTFSAWVNLNNLNAYKPILSRGNIFRFGLHYGHVMLCLGDGVSLYPLPKFSVPEASNINNSNDSISTTTDNNIKKNLPIDFSKQATLDDIVKLYDDLEVISGNETEIQQIDENNITVSNTIQITSSPPSSVSEYSVKNILNNTIMWKSNSHTGSILFDFSSVKTVNKIEILNDLTSDFTGFSKLFIYSTNDKNDLPTNYSFGHDTYPMGSEGSNFITVFSETDAVKKHISISNIELETQYLQFWFQTNDSSYILSVNQIKMYTYSSSSSASFVNSSLFPGNVALQLNNSIVEIKSPNTLDDFSFFAWYNLQELNEQILFQSNSLKLTVSDTGSLTAII